MSRNYYLHQTGDEVQDILDDVQQKTVYDRATRTADGLMSNTDKQRLDDMTDVRALTFDEIDDVFNY